MGPEEITPYEDTRPKTEQVRDMFDSIAPAYDFMNRMMTLGIDRRWRSLAVKRVRRHGADRILDVATGTGDLAIKLARKVDPISVVGVDLSDKMLQLGRRKVAEADLAEIVKFEEADCMHLPLPDDSFDAVTVAFGVRNFENIRQGLSEILRVLKPGGIVVILELSRPTNRAVRWMYDMYTQEVIPFLGKLISKDPRAYTYLPESIAAVPQGPRMTALLEQTGFHDAAYKPLTLGVCTLYTAMK